MWNKQFLKVFLCEINGNWPKIYWRNVNQQQKFITNNKWLLIDFILFFSFLYFILCEHMCLYKKVFLLWTFPSNTYAMEMHESSCDRPIPNFLTPILYCQAKDCCTSVVFLATKALYCLYFQLWTSDNLALYTIK